MVETYAPWDPLGGIQTPCAQVDVSCGDSLVVTLRFSYMTDPGREDLRIDFGEAFLALMSHDEFAHPWTEYAPEETGAVPTLSGAWESYPFPSLIVHPSLWLASFSEAQVVDFQRENLRHYRFVSLDNTVDVLAEGEPDAAWIGGSDGGPAEGPDVG